MAMPDSTRVRVATAVAAALLLVSLVACVRGLTVASPLLLIPAWDDPMGSALAAAGLLLFLLGLGAVSRRFRVSEAVLLSGTVLATAAAFAGIGPVVVALLQFAAAYCIGRRVLPPDAGDADDAGVTVVVATALGLAVLSTVVGFASFLKVNNPATYLGLLVLPLAIGWRRNAASMRWAASVLASRPAAAAPIAVGALPADRWTLALRVVLGVSILVRLLAVLHPEVGQDALAMHMVIGDQLKLEGRFHYDVTRSIWAVMPMAADWQFAIASMLGGEYAARLVNFGADLLILAAIHAACMRYRGPLAAAAAAVVYSTLPLVYLETTSLFVENLWTLWVVAGLLAGLAALDAPRGRWAAAASGVLVGTALAAKVTTVFLAPVFGAIALAWLLAARVEGTRRLGLFVAGALATGVLPYANAWYRTGNPVFPFMNEIFQSPFFDATKAFDNPLFKSGFGWDSLYRATFDSGRFLEADPGALGVSLLVLLPAALAYALLDSQRRRVGAVLGVLFVALVFHFLSYLRYILPVLPLFAVLIGCMVAGMPGSPRAWRPLLAALTLIGGIAGLYLMPTGNYHVRGIHLPPFAGTKSEQDYRMHWRPEREMARVIDAMALRKVLWIGHPFIAQANTRVVVLNWHGGFHQVREFEGLASEQDLARWITANGFDAIAVSTGGNACDRAFVCDFLDRDTTIAYRNGAIALYLPRLELLFTHERLANAGFDKDTAGWSGAGGFDAADGAVRVSGTQPYFQAVAVEGGARYLLDVEGRCTRDRAPFRSQVNWLGADGGFLDTQIDVLPCTEAYRSHQSIVVAPPGATQAVVYATGHEPGRLVEVTHVSFRSP